MFAFHHSLTPNEAKFLRGSAKMPGLQRTQHYLFLSAIAFIAIAALSSIISLGPASRGYRGNISTKQLSTSLPNAPGSFLPIGETSAKALTSAQRNDRTMSDDRCRAEFPLLYPQLRELEQYWRGQGGLNKSTVDINEAQLTDAFGCTRVS